MRDKLLASGYLNSYIGGPLSKEQLDKLVTDICCEIGGNVSQAAVRNSCLYLAQTPVTLLELQKLCWRLAGNIGRLRKGKAVVPWRYQEEDEWMPLQVLSVGTDLTDRRRPMVRLQLRILAGTACPEIICKQVTPAFCRYLAIEFGFTKSWGRFPFREPSEFTTMRTYGLFTAEQTAVVSNAPSFSKFYVPQTMTKHNRQLLAARNREVTACPFGRSVDCLVCPQGQDQCQLALRRYTLSKRPCRRCGTVCWLNAKESLLCTKCLVQGGGNAFFG